jgi:hypothetical protein
VRSRSISAALPSDTWSRSLEATINSELRDSLARGASSLVIEEQLDRLARDLEARLDGDVLAIMGSVQFTLDESVRDAVEHSTERRKKVAVVLETPGGFIEVAERIVTVLRHNYEIVDFFVPNRAMSAGTVLVMAGDAIFMDYFSCLGPIDPQVQSDDGSLVPALGYLEAFDALMAKAEAGGLNTTELAYLVAKFDPALIAQYRHQRDLTISMLERWLATYKFKNWTRTRGRGLVVTPAMRSERARQIGERLNSTADWHSHGRSLTKDILERDLNLQIDDFGADEALGNAVKRYYRLLVDYGARLSQRTAVHRTGFYRGFPW